MLLLKHNRHLQWWRYLASGHGLRNEMRRQCYRDLRKLGTSLHLRYLEIWPCRGRTRHRRLCGLLLARERLYQRKLLVLVVHHDCATLSTRLFLQRFPQRCSCRNDLLLCYWISPSWISSSVGFMFNVSFLLSSLGTLYLFEQKKLQTVRWQFDRELR